MSRLDRQVFGLHALGSHFRLDRFRDLLDRQIQAVRHHRDGLRQADVLDYARFYLGAKFFDGHARPDFFLQRQPPLRGIHDAQRLRVLDALRNRGQRHDELVHHETGIHARSNKRDAPFLRGGIEFRCQLRMRSERIRQFFTRRNDARLRFQAREQLVHYFRQRRRR